MAEPTDEELVMLARAGDLDAYGVLVRRHHARVAGLCFSVLENSADADDAAQDVFLKAHRSLGGFHGEARFSTWLYRIAMNRCLDLKRHGARRRTVPLDAVLDASGEPRESLGAEPAVATDRADELKEVHRLIAGLPQSQGAALLLRAQGLDYEEISAALECTVDSVKARLRRARRSLVESLRHLQGGGGVEAADAGEGSHGPRKI